MWQTLLNVIVISYLPGALIFRLPLADRRRRAGLAAEERLFWAVIISVAVSLIVAFGLAWASRYTFDRLLYINGGLCLLIAGLAHRRLRLEPGTPRPGWGLVVPAALVAIGLWLYFPPSEYVMGGKDPGVYMNEGIQIAQRGSLVIRDPVIASVPAPSRALFFPLPRDPTFYSNRFMGFFVLRPEAGTVVGQFPHLYPVSIAIAYGLDGLTGARRVIGVWAILGLLAVYFCGARLTGRLAAATGATLLAVHVLQIWYARYPNSEMVMQALLFAGLLAYTRAQVGEDRFFAPVAATMLGLLLFLRFSGVLAVAAVMAAALIGRLDGRRLRASFVAPLALWTGIAAIYLFVLMAPYSNRPLGFFRNLQPLHLVLLALGGTGVLALALGAAHPTLRTRVRAWLPRALILVVLAAAAYAYFVRQTAPGLAPHDANSLRTFTSFYLGPYGLAAALVGYLIVVRRSFWRSPAFILTVTTFAFFFFYKARIIPEHFWMGRRFLPVILPAALLFIGAATLGGEPPWKVRLRWLRDLQVARLTLGLVFVVLLGRQYITASQPILDHVEYASLIPRLEELATHFGDEDLVLVDARGASDVHVLALPLAYIYTRNVLVFSSVRPDKLTFLEFLTWARSRYRDVFFMGGGIVFRPDGRPMQPGTDLLSRSVAVAAAGREQFEIPEYESAWMAYPQAVRYKQFDFGIYRFVDPGEAEWFSLDVGSMDDLHVSGFHTRERLGSGDTTFRWTQDASYILIVGTSDDNGLVTLWLNGGGRPEGLPPARVVVYLNDHLLGSATVTSEFLPYSFPVPADLAADVARNETGALLKIVANTWVPRDALGGGDDRELGVMVDRIEVR